MPKLISGAAGDLPPEDIGRVLSTLIVHADHHLSLLLAGDPTTDMIAEARQVAVDPGKQVVVGPQ